MRIIRSVHVVPFGCKVDALHLPAPWVVPLSPSWTTKSPFHLRSSFVQQPSYSSQECGSNQFFPTAFKVDHQYKIDRITMQEIVRNCMAEELTVKLGIIVVEDNHRTE
jgi:hypothetical protein